MDDAMDCLMSFSDFLFAFQIQFYYSGKTLPGPLVAPVGTTPPSPALLPFPSVCLAHTFLSPLPWVVCFTAPRSLTGCPVLAGGPKIQSAEPAPSASSRHRKPQRFQAAAQ